MVRLTCLKKNLTFHSPYQLKCIRHSIEGSLFKLKKRSTISLGFQTFLLIIQHIRTLTYNVVAFVLRKDKEKLGES